ncbi:MAG: LacI family DNA-binding transcriptional regulator [Clostridia bacterium]|nr:LacI family DNA-binding transcriptional regulator [Clostridia bacterium]
MPEGTPTIYDIAREAGVSIATVSRVVRGEENVSKKTREKVQAVIQSRNFMPSSLARGMSSRRSYTLGIVLPRLTNPNYAEIFTGASEEARSRGYHISMFPWQSLIDPQGNQALTLASWRLDGVIICVEYTPENQGETLIRSLEALRSYMPVVLIGCVPQCLQYPAITYHMAEIVRQTVSYLTGLGHEKIALIGGMEADQDESRRDVGYLEGLADHKLPFISSYRVFCRGTPEEGEKALDAILDGLMPAYWPTAVLALNDLVAMGLYRSAKKHGLSIPNDLSIMGCDNIVSAAYLSPALTTIDMCQQALGKRAVDLLLCGEDVRQRAEWKLVERESCGPVPQRL